MTLLDGLISLAVVGAVIWVIVLKLAEKNPKLKEFITNLTKKKDEVLSETPEDIKQMLPADMSMI